jgi:hypothetical protein
MLVATWYRGNYIAYLMVTDCKCREIKGMKLLKQSALWFEHPSEYPAKPLLCCMVFTVISMILLIAYLAILAFYGWGWFVSGKKVNAVNPGQMVSITVVVPARNE